MATNPMILLYSGHYGIYIPQIASTELSFTEPLTPEQLHDLSDPNNEGYWMTFEGVLGKSITDKETGVKYFLHMDDDLWAIQDGYYINDENCLIGPDGIAVDL